MKINNLKKLISIGSIFSVTILASLYYYILGVVSISDVFLKSMVVMPIVIVCIVLVLLVVKTNKNFFMAPFGACTGFIGGVLCIAIFALWNLLTVHERGALTMFRSNIGLVIWGLTFGVVLPATVLGAVVGFIGYLLKNKLKKAKMREGEK